MTLIPFFIFVGITLWIPELLFDTNKLWLCWVISCCVGITALCFVDDNLEAGYLRKETPITFIFLWIFIGYATSVAFVIGYSEISFDYIKQLGKSATYYAALLVAVFLIEIMTKGIKEKKAREREAYNRLKETIRIGGMYIRDEHIDHSESYGTKLLGFKHAKVWRVIGIEDGVVTAKEYFSELCYPRTFDEQEFKITFTKVKNFTDLTTLEDIDRLIGQICKRRDILAEDILHQLELYHAKGISNLNDAEYLTYIELRENTDTLKEKKSEIWEDRDR